MRSSANDAIDTATSLLISVLWEDHVLDVQDFRAPCCLSLPREPGRIRRVSVRELGDGIEAVVDFSRPDRGQLICAPPAQGTIARGGSLMAIADAAERLPETGAIRVDLLPGHRLSLRAGDLTYVVEVGPRQAIEGIRKLERWGKGAKAGVVATTLIHVGAVAATCFFASPAPSPGEVTDEQVVLMRRYLHASAQREQPSRAEKQGGTGTRAKGAEMGAQSRVASDNRYGVAGPAAGGDANAPVAELGLIGLMSTGGGGTVPPGSGVGRGAGLGHGGGFGGGHGRLGGSHRTRPPKLQFAPSGFTIAGRGVGGGAAVSHGVTGGAGPRTKPVRRPGASIAPAPPPRTASLPPDVPAIDPNGRFATTYRPGRGHLTAFETAVSRGVIEAGDEAIVAGVGARHVPELPTEPGESMAFAPALERTLLPPTGGSFHLRFTMQSTPGEPATRPRLAVHLVLDTSGSMQGAPISHARDAARAVVARLAPEDEFSLVTFDSDGIVRVPGGPVGLRRRMIADAIDSIRADGGTNLGEGLKLAYAQATRPAVPEDAVPVVLVVSDGQANEGITDAGHLSRIALDAFQDGVQTSTFGVGVDYDGPLMSRVAADGAGGYYYLPSSDQIGRALTTELDKRLRPVATAMEIRIRLHPGVELLHVYGSRRLDGDDAARVRATEVAADRLAEKRDGIDMNRHQDREGGMRFFIPAFAAGDRHALLLEVRAPAGAGEQKVGVVEVRYKDRSSKRNRAQEYPVRIAYASSDAESASSADPSVIRTIQGFKAGESLLTAARLVAEGDLDRAMAEVIEREAILLQAATRYQEPAFLDDAARLTRIRTRLDVRDGQLALATLLESAGRASL